MKGQFLSNLLPYDANLKKHGCLKKGLKEYQSLLKALLEAAYHFEAGDLEKFDSLVGENACEIRALWVAAIELNDTIDAEDLRDRVSLALKTVDSLLVPSSIDTLMRNDVSLKDLIEKQGFDILLTIEELFLIQSFILTEMKLVMDSEKQMCSLYRVETSDPKKLCRFGDVSISFTRGLISKVRRMLATASVQFVRSLAYRFQDQTLIRMVSDEFTVLHNTLPCIPMFWTYKAVLQAAKEEGIPLVIHAKFIEKNSDAYVVVSEDYMVFQVKNGEFVEMDSKHMDRNRPAFVIQGVVANENGQSLTKAEWKELMRQTSVVDVVLAGAADHRQFPDSALDARIEQLGDSEYESYKAMAKRSGFSDENPTTFFIQHVYAAPIGKIVKGEILNLDQLRELIQRSSASHCIPIPGSTFGITRYANV